MANIRTEEVKLTVDGKEMTAFLALPEAAGPRPAVLVFEEIFGVNVHIRDVAERLAREGWVAIAPDYHHRAWRAGTQLGYTPDDMKRGMEVIPKLTADGISADINATIAYLKTRKEVNAQKLGAIGFCIGGHVAYLAAATQPIAATASFYGGGIATFAPGGGPKTVERTGGIKGRILCLFGKDDPMIPQDQVATIKHALEENEVRHEVVVYEGASHAFFCDVATRGSYREKPAQDAWERVKSLFKEELG
ncbi:MAG: dienelactone hydrolase-like enzyme [bacterium]|nr:dienelactone hydrolase-like enzyme [bacterium]